MNKPAEGAHANVAQMSAKVTEAGLRALSMCGGNQNIHDAIYVSMGGVSGALQMVAGLIGKDKNNPITNDSLLFSALMVAECNRVVPQDSPLLKDRPKPDDGDDGGRWVAMACEYSKESLLRTMENFEKLTGRKADEVLSESVVKAIREFEASGIKTADDLLNVICANKKPS